MDNSPYLKNIVIYRIFIAALLFCIILSSYYQVVLAASTGDTTKKKIEEFVASDATTRDAAIFNIYTHLFNRSYAIAPGITIARQQQIQKQKAAYTAAAKRYSPTLDAKLSRVHELNYNESEYSATQTASTYEDDRDYSDWSLNLDLPLFNQPLIVSLHIAKAEEELAKNALLIATQEFDLNLKELLGNYLESTYRLFNIGNSVSLSEEHVGKIQRGFELRDQTRLQLLRAQANLKDLETRLDLAEQEQEASFHALLDFTGLEGSDLVFTELTSFLVNEIVTAGSINSLAAINHNSTQLQHYIADSSPEELFSYLRKQSVLHKKIVLEKIISQRKSETYTQDEWFEISVEGEYERRDDTKFSEYEGEGTLSLVLSVPLFSGGTLFSNKASKTSALQIALTKETSDIRALFHSMANTKKSITSLQKVYLKQQINLKQQQEIVELSLKSYQIKQTSMQDLLTSQNSLIDAKNSLIQTTNKLGTLFRQFAWQLGVSLLNTDIPNAVKKKR